MSHREEGLPATSLYLFATALLLFGVGGGLVGYMIGERHGEARADAIVGALAVRWDTLSGDARSRFDGAIGSAAALLEKAAADVKTEVSMYHGCGAICHVIADRFGEELLHARDAVKKAEPPASASWSEVVHKDDPLAGAAPDVQLTSRFSGSTVIATVALLSTTVAACFAIACVTVLKLRAIGPEEV